MTVHVREGRDALRLRRSAALSRRKNERDRWADEGEMPEWVAALPPIDRRRFVNAKIERCNNDIAVLEGRLG